MSSPRIGELQPAQVRRLWEILVRMASADPDLYQEFAQHMLSVRRNGHEFRFMGALGFGGKLHWMPTRGAWVSYYAEDRDVIRDEIVAGVNQLLACEFPPVVVA